jgi:beta-N-acetylhexosaminidase
VALWGAAPACALVEELAFERDRQAVLAATAAEAEALGRHFIVGYGRLGTAETLARRGLIGGVFVTSRNVAGRSAAALHDDIVRLQRARRDTGLPPLIVAADQEGGIVSRLSPPLSALPPLASLASLAPAARDQAAADYGRIQGGELAALGVTLDLAPVVDLRPAHPVGPLDRNSRIERRAISDDPATVAAVALAYSRALRAAGVTPTLQHFPGLGRVAADTHRSAGVLTTDLGELERTDWLPFRRVLADGAAALMLGHVAVAAVDPARPASQSRRVAEGLLRGTWGYRGVLITDDLTMAPIYRSGLCTAVVGGLSAGIDLLLLSYDDAQYFPAMACALDALRHGRLDAAMLARSAARLTRLTPAG